MKLTYRQIEFLVSNDIVQGVLDKATGRFGLGLYRVISKIQLEAEPFRKQMQKIIDTYAQKKEDGTPVVEIINGQQTVLIIPGKELEAANEVEDLRSQEIEIPIDPIEINMPENSDITTRELLSIRLILK